jgi:Cysteine rich repeat
MTRFLFAIPLVLALILMAPSASAQQGQDACARDVSRYCRAHMNEGDMVVLACLKQNRARLSKACQQVLVSHGQ